MKITKILSVLSLSLSILALAGCKQSAQETEQSKVVVLSEGKTRVVTLGTSADYPPFEFKKQGEFVGIDIDIAKAIVGQLGYELKIVDMDFGSLVGAVKSGRVDFVMAALTASPERLKNIDFSDIYYQAEIAAIYKEGSSFKNLEDFQNKTAGAQLGTIMEIHINQVAQTQTNLIVKTLNKNPELIQELKLGRLDVVIVEEAQAVEFSKSTPGLTYNTIPNTGEGYALGFKKGAPLKGESNRVLRQLQEDGTLAQIKTKWIQKIGNDQ